MKSANSSITFSETSLKSFPSPQWEGGYEKIGLVLFDVIPAKAGIQWFHGATNTLDPGFHRGDEYSLIFSQLQGMKGRGDGSTGSPQACPELVEGSTPTLTLPHRRGRRFWGKFQIGGLGRISLVLFFLLSVGVSPTDASETLKKASFIPQWSPQAQFAGYYVAYEKGFYKKNGIDLTILPGGPDQPSSQFLAKGKADFATLWLSTALRLAANGEDIINIGQMVQRSALMLVAKKSSNIRTPEDMNGKKVSLWGEDFQIQPKAFFKRYNLKVKIIPQSFSVNLFLRGGVDVASAMWYNEYHTLISSGLNPEELTTFSFHEYGLNFPEDGIYTLQKTFRKDPALACAFLKGSIAGWLYAFSHPDEALDIILRYLSQAKIPANRIHQKWMLERMKDLISPTDHHGPIGMLDPRDYERVDYELKENDLVKRTPSYYSFFVRCDKNVEK